MGVTSDLIARIWQHKQDLVDEFSENQLKKWDRDWKIELIEKATTAGKVFIRTWCLKKIE